MLERTGVRATIFFDKEDFCGSVTTHVASIPCIKNLGCTSKRSKFDALHLQDRARPVAKPESERAMLGCEKGKSEAQKRWVQESKGKKSVRVFWKNTYRVSLFLIDSSDRAHFESLAKVIGDESWSNQRGANLGLGFRNTLLLGSGARARWKAVGNSVL